MPINLDLFSSVQLSPLLIMLAAEFFHSTYTKLGGWAQIKTESLTWIRPLRWVQESLILYISSGESLQDAMQKSARAAEPSFVLC